MLHGSIGADPCNTFGLWQGNQVLLDACQTNDAYGAADVILLALWHQIHGEDEDLSTARVLLAEVGEPEEDGKALSFGRRASSMPQPGSRWKSTR